MSSDERLREMVVAWLAWKAAWATTNDQIPKDYAAAREERLHSWATFREVMDRAAKECGTGTIKGEDQQLKE